MNKKVLVLVIAIVLTTLGVGVFIASSSGPNNTNNDNLNENINESNNLEENNNVPNLDENSNSGNNLGNIENNSNNDDNSSDAEDNEETSNSDNIAIVYFSATGTTRRVAEYIKDATGGDLIEIEPKEKYTDDDLNYNNTNSRSTREQNDSSVRPEIANTIDTSSFDVIYLGYPIWWGDAPRIILTFLDTYDLSGKTVIPFCTSGGSGIGSSVSYFSSLWSRNDSIK